MPTSRQVCEHHAEDYTRAAANTDDAVFRNMLLTLALQWRLAAQEDQIDRKQGRSEIKGA